MRLATLMAAAIAALFEGSSGFTVLIRPSSVARPWPQVDTIPARRAAALFAPELRLRKRRLPATPLRLKATAKDAKDETDMNRLQTSLNAAIEAEDYTAAAKYRDLIKQLSEDADGKATCASWEALQVPPWLADRAERLGFRIPAQVQRNAMQNIMTNRDTVIVSPTGSGKTLAYLMPMLALLSDDLLDDDILLHLTRFQSKQATRSQRVSKLVDRELSPTPLAVIVVPTRELGVQVSTLCYMLLGGSRNNPTIMPERMPTTHKPGSKVNMFTYKGPRRVKVVGVWDEEALNASMPVEDYGLDSLKGAHILVVTPKFLSPLSQRGHISLSNARVVVLDEADECLAGQEGAALKAVFAAEFGAKYSKDGTPRVRIFAGASLVKSQVAEVAEAELLDQPATVGDGVGSEGGENVWDRGQQVPASIVHRYIVSDRARALGTLTKVLRNEIESFQAQGLQARIIVYAKDAPTAVRIAPPLQNSLWTGLGGDIDKGLWGVSVLLPSAEDTCKFAADNTTLLTYESSLRVMEKFFFDQVSLLVTTPLATRGLDFPNVTHVLNLGIVGTKADYLHRAGRCGRIGQDIARRAVCISVLQPPEVPLLQALGKELGFTADMMEALPEAPVTEESSKDDKIRLLEDTFQLFSDDGATPGDDW